MCLNIQNVKHSYKYESINGEQLIPVWKILAQNNCSPLLSHLWTKGWNKSNRIHKDTFVPSSGFIDDIWEEKQLNALGLSMLTKKSFKRVVRGFHFYLTKKEAEQDRQIWINTLTLTSRNNIKTVKMYVRKTDIIARGTAKIVKGTSPRVLAAMNAYWKGN